MKYILIIICFLAICSCTKQSDCSIWLGEKYIFLEHNGFGDKYMKKSDYTLCIIQNPYNWDYNLYFTGDGWSYDVSKACKSKDTCNLKILFKSDPLFGSVEQQLSQNRHVHLLEYEIRQID